jgi:hypothetical protein
MERGIFDSLTSFKDEGDKWKSQDIIIHCVDSPYVESSPYPIDITDSIGQLVRNPRDLHSKRIDQVNHVPFFCSEPKLVVPNITIMFRIFSLCSEKIDTFRISIICSEQF